MHLFHDALVSFAERWDIKMKKMWKYLGCLLLLFCLGCLPQTVSATVVQEIVEEISGDYEGFQYWVEGAEGEASVRVELEGNSVLKEKKVIHIPEQIEGYPVVEVWVSSTGGKVETLYLPKTVKIFHLENYTGSNTIKNIHVDKENPYFSSKSGIVYDKKQTTLVQFPPARKKVDISKKIKKIGDSAFASSDLEKVVIPDTVTTMESHAFIACENLKSVKISKKLKKLENGVFYACKKLKSVTIPANVVEIEYAAFRVSGLEKVTFQKNSKLKILAGFNGCKSLKTIQIPETVKEIGCGAFEGCDSLKSLKIPKGVKKIDSDVFMDSDALKKIEIPENVESLGYAPFNGCKNLKTIVIRSTKIDKESMKKAFDGMNKKQKKKINIVAKKNSAAYKYAKKNGFKVKAL